jgi:hypothetical protein
MLTDNLANDIAFIASIFGPLVLLLAISVGKLIQDIRRA